MWESNHVLKLQLKGKDLQTIRVAKYGLVANVTVAHMNATVPFCWLSKMWLQLLQTIHKGNGNLDTAHSICLLQWGQSLQRDLCRRQQSSTLMIWGLPTDNYPLILLQNYLWYQMFPFCNRRVPLICCSYLGFVLKNELAIYTASYAN